MEETDAPLNVAIEDDEESDVTNFSWFDLLNRKARIDSLALTNFLSYKKAKLEFGDFTALVGLNSSGKSNAVSAIKLLRDLGTYGLPIAIKFRGGFDQLRHRSTGHPRNPALRLTFTFPDSKSSYYEIKLGAVSGKRYRVTSESAHLYIGDRYFYFHSDGKNLRSNDFNYTNPTDGSAAILAGESALSIGGMCGLIVRQTLQQLHFIDVNPFQVGTLQNPSSSRDFEPDGSNATDIFENLSPEAKGELTEELAAVVPGISKIVVRILANKQIFVFSQSTKDGQREFYANQMSDGTLRAFSILLALKQLSDSSLIVFEEPEIAIHLGASRTLIELLKAQTSRLQIVITTHSADVVDSLSAESLRVVWREDDCSHVARLDQHSRRIIAEELISPGELLRSDALDPDLSNDS